jgi:hypothetical protein
MTQDPELNEAMKDTQKLAAVVAPDANEVAGLTLRPFGAASLAQLLITGNKLVQQTEDQSDIAFHVLAFLYIHAAPVKTVRRVVMDKGAFADAVWEFADTLKIKDLVQAGAEIKTIVERGMVGLDYEVESGGNDQRPN